MFIKNCQTRMFVKCTYHSGLLTYSRGLELTCAYKRIHGRIHTHTHTHTHTRTEKGSAIHVDMAIYVAVVAVVTQALVVCLICPPSALGPHVLQLLCNTSFSYKWLHYIYSSTYYFRLWVRIMTFILRF